MPQIKNIFRQIEQLVNLNARSTITLKFNYFADSS